MAIEDEQTLKREQLHKTQTQQALLISSLSSRYRLNVPQATVSKETAIAEGRTDPPSPKTVEVDVDVGGSESLARGGWEQDGGGDEVAQGLHVMVDKMQMSAETEENYLRLFRTLRDAVAGILPEAKVGSW